MKNAFERIIKNENRIVSALRGVMINLKKMQSDAFYRWKDNMNKDKLRDAERKLKAEKLNNALSKPTRR